MVEAISKLFLNTEKAKVFACFDDLEEKLKSIIVTETESLLLQLKIIFHSLEDVSIGFA